MEKKEECGFDIMSAHVRKSDVGGGGGGGGGGSGSGGGGGGGSGSGSGSGGGGGGEEDGTISFLPTILAMHSLYY